MTLTIQARSKLIAFCFTSFMAFLNVPALAQDDRPFGIHHNPFGDEYSIFHYGRDRTYDVHHLKLEIFLDEKDARISGTATSWLSPLNKNLQILELDSGDLKIKRVSLRGGKEAEGMNLVLHKSSVPPEPFEHDKSAHEEELEFAIEGEKLRINLPRPYSPAETLAVAITYEANPKKGLFFVQPDEFYPDKPFQIWTQGEMEDSHFWFPCYDYPNDKMTSEMVATVNEKFNVVSNGELLEVKDNMDGTKTFHWKESVPHSSYLTSLVAGEFRVLTDSYQDIKLEYYVPKELAEMASRSFSKTPDMLGFFSDITGIAYPYEKYAQVAVKDFIFGGMENISATTLTENTLHDAIAALDISSEGLVAHELAHQWWGDMVTCENWSHAWLNESFATYFDALYVEHSKGKEEFQWRMQENKQNVLEEDFDEYRRPIVTFSYADPINVFDSHLYPKGAWVLHMLRFELGNEIFFKGLQHYLKQNAFQPVETADLRQALEEVSGKNLDLFFDQWLYQGGYPEFDLNWSWDFNKKKVKLKVKQVQIVDDLTPVFIVPVDVELTNDSGSKIYRVRCDSLKQEFEFNSEKRPLMVLFDPDGWILKLKRFNKTHAEWGYQLTHASSVVSRVEAASALGMMAPTRVSVEVLRNALEADSFYGVRIEAAKSLGKLGTAGALAALKKGLTDPKSAVRREVANALGNYQGNEQAANLLIQSFKKDKSYYVRSDALEALGKIQSKQAPAILKEGLKVDSHRQVIRSGALRGFGKFADISNAPLLVEWARYGHNEDARLAAIRALGDLGKANPSNEIGEFLTGLLTDPSFRARIEAANALGEMKYTGALEELQNSGKEEWDGRMRRQARLAIKRILDLN